MDGRTDGRSLCSAGGGRERTSGGRGRISHFITANLRSLLSSSSSEELSPPITEDEGNDQTLTVYRLLGIYWVDVDHQLRRGMEKDVGRKRRNREKEIRKEHLGERQQMEEGMKEVKEEENYGGMRRRGKREME